MSDFLLELRSEEIPARMQAGARADLERLFRAAMKDAGVTHGEITVWSTPRRLALIARDVPDATEAVREEVKGPKTTAPAQALEGFLRKTGLTQDQLTERDGVWFAVTEKPGRATIEVLAETIPAIIRAFPWPKSMRWGAASITTESQRWVRPLSGIVAILGDQLVPCEIAGITAQYATLGHRFHHPDKITIGGANDYEAKLNAAHVIVDHVVRQNLIREGAKAAAASAGLTLVEDEGLVIENAGLTEWPVPLLGRFDPEFLQVPPEVIQLTARTNQKYFICTAPRPLAGGAGGGLSPASAAPEQPTPNPSRKRAGDLANAFVCTANIAATGHGTAIIDGNRKVLAARLSDARFFWEQDRKRPLAEHALKLDRITFHEKLGTVADKVERVAKLAEWLAIEGIVPGCDPKLARQAAELCKADLVTEMVGEFPELQGLMGGYYASAEGLPDAVADAIRDHYKPVGQGDDIPNAPVTVAVSLADKLDTLVGFFAIDERPTGSKDPYALRRAMLGIVETIVRNDVRVGFREILRETYLGFANCLVARKFVLWQDFEDDDKWSPLLAESAAFKGDFGELVVLKSEPPSGASDFNEDGKEEWDISQLSKRGIIDFKAFGFEETVNFVNEFCFDRLRDREKRAGRRPDVIQAILAINSLDASEILGRIARKVKMANVTSDDDIVRILRLSSDLEAFIGTEDGVNLLAGYKRAANILKKEGYSAPAQAGASGGGAQPPEMPASAGMQDAPISLSYTPEPAEKALVDSLADAGPRAATAVEAEQFAGAMAALATLRGPIDAFFDSVTVNDPAPEKRSSRLALLDSFRAAVHKVADFSKIEG